MLIDEYDVYNPYDNREVTQYYVEMIRDAAEYSGKKTNEIQILSFAKRNVGRGIIVVSLLDVIKAKLVGYRSCVLWMQGALPEESYVRNKSIVRKVVLDLFERIAISMSDTIILVSEEMRKHLEKKHHIYMNNVVIIPCFNEDIKKDSFLYENKYANNTFLYVGGLSKWQQFETIVRIYGYIERKMGNCRLGVFTKDVDLATKIILNEKVKNFEVKYVKKEKLSEEIRKYKFGFAIRDCSIVNRVSTPTKLSNYLANGIIPIYSSCIVDFNRQTKNLHYCIGLDELFNIDELEKKILRSDLLGCLDAEKLYSEYERLFDNYYCKDYYIKLLSEYL